MANLEGNVYFDKESYQEVRRRRSGSIIFCTCVESLDRLMPQLGFRWYSELEMWGIPARDFTIDIYIQTKRPKIMKRTNSYFCVKYLKTRSHQKGRVDY
jgi:hypothetical protein